MFKEAIELSGKRPTRTDETTEAYIMNARCVVGAAERERGENLSLVQVTEWFAQADGRFKSSTIRQYRAGLRALAQLQLREGELTQADIDSLEALLVCKPSPQEKTGPQRTSAKKRKAISEAERQRLRAMLQASGSLDDRFLAAYIMISTAVFPRPCEWAQARRESNAVIIVNAKTSNGRSHGPERVIAFEYATDDLMQGIDTFLAELRRRIEAAGDRATFHRWLARQLTRACERAGIAPLAPYSLRHSGMASAKKYCDAQTVAYLAGHACDRTATSHYAPARSGLKGVKPHLSVSPENLAKVRVTGRASRRSNMARKEHALRPPRP